MRSVSKELSIFVLMLRYVFIFTFVGSLFAYSRSGHFFGIRQSDMMDGIRLETVMLLDEQRDRLVPVAIYTSYADSIKDSVPVVMFNHGYGKNQGNSYLTYSYLNEFLVSKGYCVISIQHEVKTDNKLPMEGDLQQLRQPFWERGSENIRFVIHQMDSMRTHLDFQNITLIGHSNGGDIAAHFASLYPDSIRSLITLDNLRKPLPKNGSISVLSLRASDTQPDIDVLPSAEEVVQYPIKIVQLPNTNHADMNDKATEEQKKEITQEIEYFLLSER